MIAGEIKLNPKKFYKYANSFRKTKTKIGPLKTIKDNKPFFESGPAKMAEMLSAQYESVFTKPKRLRPTFSPTNIEAILNDIDISTEAMKAALQSISYYSAVGPDKWTPYFLRVYADELSPALCQLWRKSLDTSIMPDDINLAIITPIFKMGPKVTLQTTGPSPLLTTLPRLLRKS